MTVRARKRRAEPVRVVYVEIPEDIRGRVQEQADSRYLPVSQYVLRALSRQVGVDERQAARGGKRP